MTKVILLMNSILLIGLILFTSCDVEVEDNLYSKLDTIPEKVKKNNIDSLLHIIKGEGYFPLHMGNYWDLAHIPKRSIDNIENLDGNDYFRMVSDRDTVYYRKTEDSKIYKRKINTHEILKFDLTADVGQTWTYKGIYSDGNWCAILLSKNDTIELDSCTFYNCYRFYYDIPQSADEEHIIWLAPDIGFIEEYCFGGIPDRKMLEKVKINGVEIGFY